MSNLDILAEEFDQAYYRFKNVLTSLQIKEEEESKGMTKDDIIAAGKKMAEGFEAGIKDSETRSLKDVNNLLERLFCSNYESNKRNDILEQAKTIINGERQGTYGNAEDSFQIISDLWGVYLSAAQNNFIDIQPEDVANMMILMKVARNSSGVYKEDNWIDICGYAALGGEIGSKA